MEVIHVVDSLAASGGAENRLVEEVEALAARGGMDQTVVRLYGRDALRPRLEDAGVEVVALGFDARNAGRTWLPAAGRLGRLLRKRRPAVVHTSLFSANLVGQLAAWPLGIPVVSSFNRTGDLDLQRALQPGVAGWRGRTMHAVARAVARRGDVHYRAVSAYARDTNCALMGFPRERVTVVPRGIDLAALPGPAPRSTWGLPEDVPLVVNVARLVPEKAQHLLVTAFAGVREVLPAAVLAIAGAPGSNEGEVREAIEHYGLGDAVRLLGFRDDARALVAAADVFAFSSLSEGSPGAVLEALALGTPVVAFDIPPVRELTEGGRQACLVPAGAVNAMGDEIVAAYRCPRGLETREWAERYDVAAVADQLAALLTSRARPR